MVQLATAGAGALLIVNGLHALYAGVLEGDPTDALVSIAQRVILVLFAILFAVSFLAQRNYAEFGRRGLR